MTTNGHTAPKVFISYSHDSPEHVDRVLGLANRLVADGVDCILDQYESSPPEGWPRWMDKHIRESNFVLVICTETYCQRAMGTERPGTGLGVRCESSLSYQQIYNAGTLNTKFIPVLFNLSDTAHIPTLVQGATPYLGHTEEGYEDLYRRITNQPRIVKPKLGKLRQLPPRERKQNFFAPPWNVPYERNLYFTGRDNIIKELANATSIKLHLALLSFLPPTFTIVGLMIWWINPYLAVLSNVLIWSAVILLIPAIYGEVHRFSSKVNKSLLILDILFFILLWITILAPQLMTMEVILVMSVMVIGFAIAAKIHKTSNQG